MRRISLPFTFHVLPLLQELPAYSEDIKHPTFERVLQQQLAMLQKIAHTALCATDRQWAHRLLSALYLGARLLAERVYAGPQPGSDVPHLAACLLDLLGSLGPVASPRSTAQISANIETCYVSLMCSIGRNRAQHPLTNLPAQYSPTAANTQHLLAIPALIADPRFLAHYPKRHMITSRAL